MDLGHYSPQGKRQERTLWERWERELMGFKPSPYLAIQGARHTQDFAMGDPSLEQNVFRWSRVQLNLPGDPVYDPTLP